MRSYDNIITFTTFISLVQFKQNINFKENGCIQMKLPKINITYERDDAMTENT